MGVRLLLRNTLPRIQELETKWESGHMIQNWNDGDESVYPALTGSKTPTSRF
ncbi:hypothetical protein WMZ97_00970 [Lentibacillus sp. N15]|uniref:hypothetical protein n=1 Tax=Lentibacillus songyuanensis TaxID=3136161 RepID=UPI0031BBBFFC